VFLIVLSSLIGLLSPWPFAFLIDTILTPSGIERSVVPGLLASLLGDMAYQPIPLIIFTVIVTLTITVLSQGLGVFDNYVHTKLDLRISLDFRSDMFAHVQRLSLAHHDQRQSGMMIYAVNNMGDAASRLVMAVPGLAQSVLTLVGMVCVSLYLDWELALLSLIVVPFLYYSVGYYVKHIQERLYHVKALEGQTLSVIHEALSMIRVIVAFGREDYEWRRYREQGEKALDARVRLTVRQTLFSLAVDAITATGTALVLGFGAYHVLENRLRLGELTVILGYIAAIYKPLETISSTVGSLQDVLTSLKIAYDVLDMVPDIKDEPGAVAIGRARGRIVFHGVGFSYTGRVDTLRDITFDAQVGQVIGIVGPTGAGKTTLVSLLPRFYQASEGRIMLDGRDIRGLTLRSLREQISIVHQEPLLFSGSIRENIRYGRLEATMDEIIEAARAANAHDFIMNLPQQYDTELGERGAKLSGGERQRIAVARAFLKDAPILILDEPTSSIDSKTEAVILDALDRLMEGRTTFMIAHRLSTIRRADRILVLEHGRLVEQGTHDELQRRDGLYKSLYEMQTNHERRRGLSVDGAASGENGADRLAANSALEPETGVPS
jgi:ABC-type multidrug transport system fused ATPase/permease subunit